jgi:hypothetical protein
MLLLAVSNIKRICIPAQNYLKNHIFAELISEDVMPTRLLYCLMLILTATGCCRNQDLPLNPTLTSWIPYASGQEITFVNEGGHKLVFHAGLSHFNQEGSDKVCGSYDIETRQVNLTSRDEPGFKVQVTISHEILVGIKVLRTDPAALGLDILYNTISGDYISNPYRDRFLPEATLNGKTYPQVLSAFGTPAAGPLSFDEIYYGREAGLIGFKLFTGETYFVE